MFIYKKFKKKDNVTYYWGQNNANSKTVFIIADLSIVRPSLFEQTVAWVNKAKKIEWNDDYEHLIDKNIVKEFVMKQL